MLDAGVAALPLIAVIALTVALRKPAYLGALCGIATVIVLIAADPAFGVRSPELLVGLGAAALLTLDVAVVMLPGLYLNELLARRGVHDRLVDWTESLPMPMPYKVALIITGLAPGLESLTGFGVSLLVTVPLLLALGPRRSALRQALIGMNIMPWGTLALATIVGAALSGQRVSDLGFGASLISAGVFPLVGAIGAASAASRHERFRPALVGALLGTVFSASLISFNALGLVPVAGVAAGLITVTLGLLWLCKGAAHVPWRSCAPFGVALAVVAAVRLLTAAGVPLDFATVTAGTVSFNPVTSPGLALAIAAVTVARGRIVPGALRVAVSRIRRPLLTLGGFTVMSQLMVAGGLIAALGGLVSSVGRAAALPLSGLLGMISGYLTGSNVGGNALMMPLQATTGASLGHPLLYAALQDSAAGHAVFASLPIVVLTLAIAGGARQDEEASLMRYGLKIAVLVYAVIMTAALVAAVILH